MGRVIRGALAGIVATLVMSGVMAVAKALGLFEEAPPRQITRNVESDSGLRPREMPKSIFDLSWVAAHFGFGASCGALYALVGRFLPGSPMVSGTLFGLGVWTVNYAGVLPALQLYPSPAHDRSSRTAVMIAAHVVFGAVLGKTAGKR
jgi:uncharacterized membrane protein YagU involved in acid resistance